MKKKLSGTIAVIALYSGFYAQKKDTVNIPELVITGQYSPQSIKKSLYKVEVISGEDIKRMAANNVAEVLGQTLNIFIVPEKKSGDSKADIMGMRADYTKVLVDNIPVVGDTGLGSNIDLTKLSLDNIEKIEIVKGSMGVEFGNNAVAGVINIITKKSSKNKWGIRGFLQEETVGKEYDWIDYGKGRHIQSLGISHNISDKWYADLSLNRNDFQGFWGNLKGKNYFGEIDGVSVSTYKLRGYEWQPKEQWNPAFMLRFSSPKTQFFYKADYLLEEINYYNPVVEEKYLGAGQRTLRSIDKNYFTDRMLHHFNIQTELFRKTKFTGDFSYQKQTRKSQEYDFDIPAREVVSKYDEKKYYQAETFYSKGTVSNFLTSEKINVQVGYEADFTKGFAGSETGSFNDQDVMKDVLSVGVFASAEFNLSSNWFLRPGFRMNFSDTFTSAPNFSLVIKNRINDQSEFRAIIGSANRNPTFDELFSKKDDVNHKIFGNEDLKSENSYSGTLYYSIFSRPDVKLKWSADISSMYLQNRDRIELVVINNQPVIYKYINVDTYQSWINAISGKISNKNFGISAGFSVLGRVLEIGGVSDNKYTFSTEINASAYYNLLKSKTSFAVYYKGVGKTSRITEEKSLGVTLYDLTEQNSFSLLDATISQKIWKDHFTITLGVRNLFDVGDVTSGLSSTGGTHTNASVESMFYGRSYFGRLNFNF